MTEGEVAFLANVQVAVKLVQITVGGLRVDLGRHEDVSWVEIDGARGDEFVEVFGRSLDFQVFLTVERASLNIAGCVRGAGGHENHVCRELLVCAHENHVAHFHIFRLPHPQLATLYELDLLLVSIHVTLVALVVLESLSRHRDAQDESKWRVRRDGIHRRDLGNRVENRLEQEVYVRLTLELVHERQRQKAPECVLGRPDVVVSVVLVAEQVELAVVHVEESLGRWR